MNIQAIILAAGAGRRMGGPKALLRIQGGSFLAHVAGRFCCPAVSGVIAVLGHQARRVEAEADLPREVAVVNNPRYAEGMLTSVLAGLDAAEARGAEAVLLHPVDHPLVEQATVEAIAAALRGGALVVVPSHAGRRGHPAGFSRATWSALRAADPARGARAVLADHPHWVTHVPGGRFCRAGVDTPEDYARWIGSATP